MISLTDERIIQIAYDFVNCIIKFKCHCMTLNILNCFYDTFIVIVRSLLSLIVQGPIHSNSMGKKNEQDILHSPFYFANERKSHGFGGDMIQNCNFGVNYPFNMRLH